MNINVGKVIANNRKAVTTSASRLETTANELKYGLQLLAENANTATIYVGKSGVGTGDGFPIDPSGALFLPIDDISNLWAISSTGTQYLRYIGI